MTTTPPPGADGQTDDAVNGTFECQICGKDTPHAHNKSETIRFHQQYRPAFEVSVFKRIRRTDTTYHFYAVGGIEIKSAHRLGYPASQARNCMDWAERQPGGDGYAQEWLQTLWEFHKEGIRTAVAAAAPPEQPEPKIVLSLPDYDKRRIVIASDEVIDGERLVCVAIEDAAAGAPVRSQPVGNVTWGTRGHTFHWNGEIPTSGKTELYAAAPLQVSGATSDGCKFCLGAKGGVPGNANVIGGETVCDYCTSLMMSIVGAEKVAPTTSIFDAQAGAVVGKMESDKNEEM